MDSVLATRKIRESKALSVTQRSQADSDELRIKATAVSRGVGIGPAILLPTFNMRTEHREIAVNAVDSEIDRFKFAVERAREQLVDLAISPSVNNESISGIFDTHLLILESFAKKVIDAVRSKRISSEWAIVEVLKYTTERQAASASDHIREKQLDLKDVAARIVDELRQTDCVKIAEGSIIVIREIRPSYVMEIARSKPAAIVSLRGGWTSHSAILARELGIPMVTGIDISSIQNGDFVKVNGFSGEVSVRPNLEVIETPTSGVEVKTPAMTVLREPKETLTEDNVAVRIRVNVEISRSYENAAQAGASGIGLFRSESLIPNSGKLPDEERQVAAYSEISAAVGGAGVQIRTFDVTPDTAKGTASFDPNPALGLRSIRLSLSDTANLVTQLRAIVRANALGNISVVIPMVSGIKEIVRFREILDATFHNLLAEGLSVNMPKVGAMIEVPSAVLTVREIASDVDFLCLGTNDLVQYLLAVDRDNDAVADWYQTLHPAVLRAIREVVDAGREAAIPVTVCGEMAGSPFYIPLLIGLGVRDLSMRGNSISSVRHIIKNISVADAVAITEVALTGRTASEIDASLRNQYSERWPGIFASGFLDSPHP